MIDSVAARLDQSVRMVNNLGIDLPASGLAAEHQIRNAIWRCILCSHGAECREWIRSARPGVPEFCRNHDLYVGLADPLA
jgi:hypothetical protein